MRESSVLIRRSVWMRGPTPRRWPTARETEPLPICLQSKGIIECDIERSLELYVKMCSLSVTAKSLAAFGLVLANGGIHPETGERLLDREVVRTVKTITSTCAMYNGSGESTVEVGIPSKSGVGGGILSVVDRKMGIGI